MDSIKAVSPRYDPNDEHIVRRLGWAVLTQWPNLPVEVRETILQQAVFVDDRYQTTHLNEQIAIFIRQHEGGK